MKVNQYTYKSSISVSDRGPEARKLSIMLFRVINSLGEFYSNTEEFLQKFPFLLREGYSSQNVQEVRRDIPDL
jgi:hypothetical protein